MLDSIDLGTLSRWGGAEDGVGSRSGPPDRLSIQVSGCERRFSSCPRGGVRLGCYIVRSGQTVPLYGKKGSAQPLNAQKGSDCYTSSKESDEIRLCRYTHGQNDSEDNSRAFQQRNISKEMTMVTKR